MGCKRGQNHRELLIWGKISDVGGCCPRDCLLSHLPFSPAERNQRKRKVLTLHRGKPPGDGKINFKELPQPDSVYLWGPKQERKKIVQQQHREETGFNGWK